jgi:cobalamin biosynthesis Co2+ chelatase CbiK
MIHAFLLLMFVSGELVSNDMYFRSLKSCVWYAQSLHKQGQKITAYCQPVQVNEERVRVYD